MYNFNTIAISNLESVQNTSFTNVTRGKAKKQTHMLGADEQVTFHMRGKRTKCMAKDDCKSLLRLR